MASVLWGPAPRQHLLGALGGPVLVAGIVAADEGSRGASEAPRGSP